MHRFVATALVLFALAAPAGAARGASLFARLDPRLAPALAPGAEPMAVWVEFADKGEQGPGDLAARLAQAERALTPECRSRRMRRGVVPLVDERDLPLAPEYVAALEGMGLHPYARSRWFNAVAVHASGEALVALAGMTAVARVSPVAVAAPRAREELPAAELVMPAPVAGTAGVREVRAAAGMTYGELARLHVAALHDSGFTGAGVLVCVFDEGFNGYDTHDATRNIDVGGRTRDFVRGGTDVQDLVTAPGLFAHGQWTLSAVGGNAPGVFLGPAYGARYALARTEDHASEKPVEMVNWLMAAEWADTIGADIISSSLGYFGFPDSAGTDLVYAMLDGHTSIITRAVEIAAAKGILVVSSAGNSGAGAVLRTLDAPADACGDSMLAVGATDSLGVRASYSSNGPTADGRIKPDVVAQGSAVLLASSSGTPNAYVRLSGTSFACPLTAGVVACVMQARPTWSLTQIVHAIKSTASRATSPDNLVGWGLVNGFAAVHGMSTGETPLHLTLQAANPAHFSRETVMLGIRLADGAESAESWVRVYDVGGRRVRTLFDRWLDAGESYAIAWDGTDDDGRRLPTGLYVVTFESGARRTSVRLVGIR